MSSTDEAPDAPRPQRADARRNVDALLVAARDVFTQSGVDAPVREIASRAGVGVGTVYRHFPQRSDLIIAVFRREVLACAAEAPTFAAEYEPVEAMRRWLHRYRRFVETKRGLAPALHSGDPVYEPLQDYFTTHVQPALAGLLTAAVATGEIRGHVTPAELLSAVSNLSGAAVPQLAANMIDLVIDGLRYRADRG